MGLPEPNSSAVLGWIAQQCSCSEDRLESWRGPLVKLFDGENVEFHSLSTDEWDISLLHELNIFLKVATFKNGALEIHPSWTVPKCSSDTDFLMSMPKSTPAFFLNIAMNSFILKTKALGVVIAVKNEGPWFLEWVAYHKSMGVDLVIAYSNACSKSSFGADDDNSSALLSRLSKLDEIVYVQNFYDGTISPQIKAYIHGIHLSRVVHSCEWVAFIDADEYLCPTNENDSAPEALQKIIQHHQTPQKVAAITVNWDWYASPDCYFWDNGLVQERFYTANIATMRKSISRPEYVINMEHVHYPTMLPFSTALDCSGHIVSNLSHDAQPAGAPYMLVNHYFAKSFEEFLIKRRRGRAVSTDNDLNENSFLWGIYDLTARQIFWNRINQTRAYLRKLNEDGQLACLTLRLADTSKAFLAEARTSGQNFEKFTQVREKYRALYKENKLDRRAREREIVRPYFDVSYYLQQVPWLTELPYDPIIDYLERGFRLGLDPSSSFSTREYFALKPELRADYWLNPFVHFLLHR